MRKLYRKRVIGDYIGSEKGPMIICLGGIHGNEPAGVKALDLLFKMIEVEPITNPTFKFKGRLLALKGNVPALKAKSRYLDMDLNRIWTKDGMNRIRHASPESLNIEEKEARELDIIIRHEIDTFRPDEVIVIDLHTTTAAGGIFTIVPDDERALEIAKGLYAPVITGLHNGLVGTTMSYFSESTFDMPVFCMAFEAGQHEDDKAVNRSIAAVINCLRSLKSVRKGDVRSVHDQILQRYSENLPKLARFIYKYGIEKEEEFVMKPGYINFQNVEKGEWLADNKYGKILAEDDGFILMPHYQKKGTDGFFILKTETMIN